MIPPLALAAAGMALILAALVLLALRPLRRSTYTADHAAAGPLLDRTEGLL